MNSRAFLKAGLWACLFLSVVACGSRPLTRGDRILADETLFSKDVSKELIEKVEKTRDLFDEEQKKFEKNRADFQARQRGEVVTDFLIYNFEIPEGKQPMIEEIQKKYGNPDRIDREKVAENLYIKSHISYSPETGFDYYAEKVVGNPDMKVHYYGDIGFGLPEEQEKGNVSRISVRRVLFEKKAGS